MPYPTRKPIIGDIYVPFGLFVRMLANGGMPESEIRQACSHLSERQLQTVISYARGIPADLDQRFHLLMHDGYWAFGRHVKANTGEKYWSNYQLRSVRDHGGRTAVKRYLARPQRQEGFDTVVELKMPQLSIEAMVLQAPWSNLFTPEEREIARARLQQLASAVKTQSEPPTDLGPPDHTVTAVRSSDRGFQLTDGDIQSLLQFVGYGNPAGRFWFVGMEEAGDLTYAELLTRAREFNSVDDLARAHALPGYLTYMTQLRAT